MAYKRTPAFQSARTARAWSRNQNNTRFMSSVALGPVAHTILVALMVVVIGLIYLGHATQVTNYDHQANRQEQKLAELDARRSELEVQNARQTALKKVKSSNVAKAMTSPSEVSYAE